MANFSLTLINELPKTVGDLQALTSFQFAGGYHFPKSYQAFVKEFGYGLTLGQFLIYVPMGDYCDSIFVQVSVAQSYMPDPNDEYFSPEDLAPDATLEIIKNLYLFARSENGYYLFWDTGQQQGQEFDIFMTDFRGFGFRKIAKNLYQCLDILTDDMKIRQLPFFTKAYEKTFKVINPIGK